MKDAYAKLMTQQHTAKDRSFYEKLEHTTVKKQQMPVWRFVAAAACILLLIPVTVWAAETIFGVTLISHLKGKDFRGNDAVGYQTQVENVENIPITEFSQYLQDLTESELAYFTTWEEAAQAIGIDFLGNPILTDEGTKPMKFFYTGKKPMTLAHIEGRYWTEDDQLDYVMLKANYYRNKTRFRVSATMTAENPARTDEAFQMVHSFGINYYPTNKTEGFGVEQFTTGNGIPITIVTPENSYSMPDAYFSVNNVSYHVEISGWSAENGETEEMAKERSLDVLREVLEGFTLE